MTLSAALRPLGVLLLAPSLLGAQGQPEHVGSFLYQHRLDPITDENTSYIGAPAVRQGEAMLGWACQGLDRVVVVMTELFLFDESTTQVTWRADRRDPVGPQSWRVVNNQNASLRGNLERELTREALTADTFAVRLHHDGSTYVFALDGIRDAGAKLPCFGTLLEATDSDRGADGRRNLAAEEVPTDVVGWRDIRWGMGVDEIRGTLQEERVANTDNPRRFIGVYTPLTIPDYRFGNHTYDVFFQMQSDDEALGRVLLQSSLMDGTDQEMARSRAAFDELQALLKARYGDPASRTVEQWATAVSWKFPSTEIELEFIDMGLVMNSSILTLSFSEPGWQERGNQ